MKKVTRALYVVLLLSIAIASTSHAYSITFQPLDQSVYVREFPIMYGHDVYGWLTARGSDYAEFYEYTPTYDTMLNVGASISTGTSTRHEDNLVISKAYLEYSAWCFYDKSLVPIETDYYLNGKYLVNFSSSYGNYDPVNIALDYLDFGTGFFTKFNIYDSESNIISSSFGDHISLSIDFIPDQNYFFEFDYYKNTWGNLNYTSRLEFSLIEPRTEPIPEPSTIILLGAGLAGMAFRKSQRRWTREVLQVEEFN